MGKCGHSILAAFLMLPFAASADPSSSQPVSPAVQAAQDAAAIATANATAALATATAQQTLQSTELNNTKTQLGNISAAFTAPDPSKVGYGSAPGVPTLNATYYQAVKSLMDGWFEDGAAQRPGDASSDCAIFLIGSTTLASTLQVYNAAKYQLLATIGGLKSIQQTVDAETPVRPHSVVSAGIGDLLPPVAIASAVATFGLDIAAAAKTKTAGASVSISGSSNMFIALLQSYLAKKADRRILNTDSLLIPDGTLGADPCSPGNSLLQVHPDAGSISSASLSLLLACTQQAINDANKSVSTSSGAIGAVPKDPTPDPYPVVRNDIANLTKAVAQAVTMLQSLFTPGASGTVPISVALNGEHLLKSVTGANTCFVTASTITADADSIVRDGTFISYKVYDALTVTATWQITNLKGEVKETGVKVLHQPWNKVKFADD